ncbi:MAG: hypothetical protein HQL65_10705 [Magnetococcales bacterium]|nr:hypothetical protein [Magnetococcales bacterium]
MYWSERWIRQVIAIVILASVATGWSTLLYAQSGMPESSSLPTTTSQDSPDTPGSPQDHPRLQRPVHLEQRLNEASLTRIWPVAYPMAQPKPRRLPPSPDENPQTSHVTTQSEEPAPSGRNDPGGSPPPVPVWSREIGVEILMKDPEFNKAFKKLGHEVTVPPNIASDTSVRPKSTFKLEPEPDPGSEPGTGTGTGSGSESRTRPGSGSESGTRPGSGSESGTRPGSGSEIRPGKGTDLDSEASTPEPVLFTETLPAPQPASLPVPLFKNNMSNQGHPSPEHPDHAKKKVAQKQTVPASPTRTLQVTQTAQPQTKSEEDIEISEPTTPSRLQDLVLGLLLGSMAWALRLRILGFMQQTWEFLRGQDDRDDDNDDTARDATEKPSSPAGSRRSFNPRHWLLPRGFPQWIVQDRNSRWEKKLHDIQVREENELKESTFQETCMANEPLPVWDLPPELPRRPDPQSENKKNRKYAQVETPDTLSVESRARRNCQLPMPEIPLFWNRQQEMARLQKLIAENAVYRRPIVLTGMGGVGKTQIVAEYFRRTTHSRTLVWCNPECNYMALPKNAETEPHPTIEIPGDIPYAEKIPLILTHADAIHNGLLVLDEVDDPNMLSHLFRHPPQYPVIITSRCTTWEGVADLLEVNPLSLAEGSRFLLALTRSADMESALALTHELGGLPLALVQAGTFIQRTRISLQSYLQMFRENGLFLLDKCKPLQSQYPGSVATLCERCLSQANTLMPGAIELMRVLVNVPQEYMTRDGLINQWILQPPPGQHGLTNKAALLCALEFLQRYSLIQLEEIFIRIHPVIRMIVRAGFTAVSHADLYQYSLIFHNNLMKRQAANME